MEEGPEFANWSQAVSGCEVVIGEEWVGEGVGATGVMFLSIEPAVELVQVVGQLTIVQGAGGFPRVAGDFLQALPH